MSLNVVNNATCTFCGCVCDDIELHADGERIVKAKNACSLGDAWFLNHTAERIYPDALIDGEPATLDEAIEAAARFSTRPTCRWSTASATSPARPSGNRWRWPNLIGGVVDSHTSL